MDEKPTREQLIERFAQIQNISVEEAKAQIDAPTEEEILKNIEAKTLEKINATTHKFNRAERRALKKKLGANKYNEFLKEQGNTVELVNETARKLNYIDLIQNLRELNEKKENEFYEIEEYGIEEGE